MIIRNNWDHDVVIKKWGEELIIVNNEHYCGKIMFLQKLCISSFHYHPRKHETFYCLDGKILVRLDGCEVTLTPGMSITLEPGEVHSFEGLEDSRFIEFSTHDDPEDSHRYTQSRKLA